jgi:putative membrane protein
MNSNRKPAAFRLPPEPAAAPEREDRTAGEPAAEHRRPRAVKTPSLPVITPAEEDFFALEQTNAGDPPPALPPRRRSRLGAVFFGALGLLVSLGVGLWTDRLIRDLFSRSDWLGWVAFALAVIALLSLLTIVLRELLALRRLASVEKLRRRGADILARNDMRAARALVDELVGFVSGKPETAAGRRILADTRDDIIDGADLVRLAETELMAPLDARARTLVLDAAKRVSVVTAVSPRAVVDLAYVLFEAGRLIRRLSELYGGRPGTLGFFRLARDVLAHLAVTGSIAVGDSLVQQIVGHGLAARLSAKLGEGVVNGMMTVRIGIAAMETVRPLPYGAVRRPRIGDFLSELTRFTAKKAEAAEDTEKRA